MCVAVGCVAPAGFEGWRWERGMERGAREGGVEDCLGGLCNLERAKVRVRG